MLFRHRPLSLLACGLAIQGAAASPTHHVIEATTAKAKRSVPATHVLHERGLPHWENTWDKVERVDADLVLPIRIGLKQTNIAEGHKMLVEISNPTSPNFGKHLSAQAVIDFFAPPKSAVEAVTAWLVEAGIAPNTISQSTNKQWIQFDTEAHKIEDLLAADYYIYEHGQTGTQDIACDRYHVPRHIQEHIDYITPGIRLRNDPGKAYKVRREAKAQALSKRRLNNNNPKRPSSIHARQFPNDTWVPPPLNLSNCWEYTSTECIRALYQIPVGTKAAPGNQLGIFATGNQHYSKDDLDGFWSLLYPAIPNGTYPENRLIDGAFGAAQTEAEIGSEADLDIEMAWPLIWPQQTVFFEVDDQYYETTEGTPGSPIRGFWNTFYDAIDGSYCTYDGGDCTAPDCLDPVYPDPNPGGYKGVLQCGVYKPTNVISISYGMSEAILPESYMRRQCSEIMKLGMQGVTVVIASGDSGVGGYPGDNGLANGCAGPNGTVFYPMSDSTCPYVLSVGGTQFPEPTSPNSSVPLIEQAADYYGVYRTGGGFSNYFDAPEWQTSAIEGYFKEVELNFTGYTTPGNNFSDVGDGVFRRGGRGYPDVSAISTNYVVRTWDEWLITIGTSVSTPLWAAIINLINEERLAVGKPPLGFINPILYAHPEVFNDITIGSNPGCKSTGFLAAKGWDPVTGLGTPIYPKLLDLLLHV